MTTVASALRAAASGRAARAGQDARGAEHRPGDHGPRPVAATVFIPASDRAADRYGAHRILAPATDVTTVAQALRAAAGGLPGPVKKRAAQSIGRATTAPVPSRRPCSSRRATGPPTAT
ncbi:hypothetical protein ACH4TV_43405, partial [Streptomyces sp. NPDC020898]|uniref:hypothetical protein n=1 Tax=Streptomyces sp. NPDC020898 TaxID=3365101 RepID=UPI0037912183